MQARKSWKERKEISQEYHDLGMKYFFEYMLVGGMPEAVDIFIQTGSYQRALMTLRNIYSNYLVIRYLIIQSHMN